VLNRPEVATLFSHSLESFLSTSAPHVPTNPDPEHDSLDALEPDTSAEMVAVELQYHTYTDVPWPPATRASSSSNTPPSRERAFRMHRFLTGREAGGIKPVFGVTAAMLIRTAVLGYARAPAFSVYAPHEPDVRTRVAWAVRHVPRVRETCMVEGLDVEATARAWEGRLRRGGRVREAEERSKL